MRKTHSRETDRQRSVSPSGRRYSEDFKRDAVWLVVDEKYSFRAAAEAVADSLHFAKEILLIHHCEQGAPNESFPCGPDQPGGYHRALRR